MRFSGGSGGPGGRRDGPPGSGRGAGYLGKRHGTDQSIAVVRRGRGRRGLCGPHALAVAAVRGPRAAGAVGAARLDRRDPADDRGGARARGERQLPVLRVVARAARAVRRCPGRRRQMGRQGSGRAGRRPVEGPGAELGAGGPEQGARAAEGGAAAGGPGRDRTDRRQADPGGEPGVCLSAAAVLPAAVRPPAVPGRRRAQRLPGRHLPAGPASAAAADGGAADPSTARCSRPSS